MTCRLARNLAALAVLAMMALTATGPLAGCATERRPLEATPDAGRDGAPTQPPDHVSAALSAPLHLARQPLGQIVNGGLQLPVVSRDGAWIAYLTPPQDSPESPAGPFSSAALEDVALVLAPVDQLNDRRAVMSDGACWPTFSRDGRRLLALRYDDAGRCELIVHEIDVAQTHRFELPAAHGLMLADAPDGDRVALALHDGDPSVSRVAVLDARTGAAIARAPLDAENVWQLAPQWVDQRTLVYVEGSEAAARVVLRRWRIDEAAAETIGALAIAPASPVGVVQAFAGVAQPLGPRQGRLLYYNAREDRLVVRPLEGAVSHALPARTRAACWRDDGLILAARDDELLLADPSRRATRGLIDGRSLPRWAGGHPMSTLLLEPASNPWQFTLVRLDATAPARD